MLDEQPVETTLYSLDDKAPEPAKRQRRRRDERHLSLLRVGSLTIGDRRELCLIRNVSAGGMLIRAYSPLEEGTRLTVELRQGEPVNGTVRWTKDECVGVNFDSPIDVVELISASPSGPTPRMPRIEVQCVAWIREGATVRRTTALDVSQGGLKVLSGNEFTVGAEVIVTLSGLAPIPATVRWRDQDCYGIGFNRALTLPLLVGWLQEQQERERKRAAG